MQALAARLKSGVFISSAGVFTSAFLWLLGFKAIAWWLGPEGVGFFSQLRQMAQAATVGATFGGTNSVVQGLAGRSDEVARLQFRNTAWRVVGIAGVIVVCVIVAAAPLLSQFFLSSTEPGLVSSVRWIGLAVLLNVGATYCLGVLNGYRSYKYMALAQIAGPAALVLLLAGARLGHLPPDPQFLALSFVVCFGVTCAMGAWGVASLKGVTTALDVGVLSRDESRAFIRFAFSNLVAALSATLALLLIRSWVIEAKGFAFAGFFDAGWTLTFNYTTLFLTACSVIYLPLLTSAPNSESQKACMLKTAYLVLGASILVCYTMVLLKEFLISLLYSPQFQPSGQVLMVLVIAVVFRSASWVYGAMILATRNSRILLISDLTLNLLLLATTRLALDRFASLEALSWAFVLPNFLYLVFVVEYARWKNSLMRRRLIWPLLLAGTLPLFFLALLPNSSYEAYLSPAKWFCMFIGLIVGVAALFAYKKVPL